MWTTITRGNKCAPSALVFALAAPAGCSPRRSWGAALLAFTLLLAGPGCAHKELLAPCSDYKASPATYTAGGARVVIPCDTPQQMYRPPVVTAAEPAPASTQEG